MELEQIKREIVACVEERRDDFIAIAEALYRNPETGLNEVRSAALLTGFLEREGFRVDRGLAGLPTAFRAETGEGGPVIALIAEMDALPVMGHACGHNVIAAAAIGAATALRRLLPPAAARIVVLGTPAEELGIGKVEMINHGTFAGVEFALMVHPSSRRYVIKHYLGLARVCFTFFGKPAHAAAYPEDGINALDGVIQTFNGISALRQQLRQDVRVHGIITEGGVAPNIIPERAAASFYVRADDLEELERVKARVIACAEGAALATGCRLQVDADPRVLAPLKVNRAFSSLYSAQLAWLGLQESESRADKNKGSSDIGNVSQIVPTIHPHVPVGDGINIHSEAFARATVSEQGRAAVVEGATALALTAAELVARPEIREEIVREFSS
ncbi:MAG: M20 family peptidase [Desulfuromonadales bacterium]|nr:MAG: M20 family peptidase [Desulfuromonadales bacterium]